MEEIRYNHPRTQEVLDAYQLLLNDSMALDFCGIDGKDRKLILSDPMFIREARRIKAGKYIEEIQDINEIVTSLGRNRRRGENDRITEEDDEDPTKIIYLKMKVATMRREMLSLSSNDKETEEKESLNIFFIDITKEEFINLQNVEIHEGDANTKFISDDSKEAPQDKALKSKEQTKVKGKIPKELQNNTIAYTNANGERVIEEVIE